MGLEIERIGVMMKSLNNPTPVWIQIALAAVIGIGAVYAIVVGLVCTSPNKMYRHTAGVTVEQPVVVKKPERTAQAIANGEKSFKAICSACHGMEMEGLVGPSLADTTWLHSNKESELVKLVAAGVPAGKTKAGATPMPPKGGADLSTDQIWELIYFISSKNSSLLQE